jgi:hypothetical protein
MGRFSDRTRSKICCPHGSSNAAGVKSTRSGIHKRALGKLGWVETSGLVTGVETVKIGSPEQVYFYCDALKNCGKSAQQRILPLQR